MVITITTLKNVAFVLLLSHIKLLMENVFHVYYLNSGIKILDNVNHVNLDIFIIQIKINASNALLINLLLLVSNVLDVLLHYLSIRIVKNVHVLHRGPIMMDIIAIHAIFQNTGILTH